MPPQVGQSREVPRAGEVKQTSLNGRTTTQNSKDQISPMSNNAASPRAEWERIYARFQRRRNTSALGKKREHLEAIVHQFNGRVPLAIIVDRGQRKALCERLFGKRNDFNYVIYPLGMGIRRGALRRDGEHLLADHLELL